MNRVIKFRAWDTKRKQWENLFGITSDGMALDMYNEIEMPHLELVQFTGLLDKNGKEIYEGDILKPVNPPSPKKYNRVVEFLNGSFCYSESPTRGNRGYWNLTQGKARLFEVIGNIYENPELLK